MEKIKLTALNWLRSEQGKDILTILIIILVGIGSFILGRFSKDAALPEMDSAQMSRGASVVKTSTKARVESADSKNFYASSRGTKYYTIGCTSNIKAENKIYFKTAEEAEAAGYTLSSSCN